MNQYMSKSDVIKIVEKLAPERTRNEIMKLLNAYPVYNVKGEKMTAHQQLLNALFEDSPEDQAYERGLKDGTQEAWDAAGTVVSWYLEKSAIATPEESECFLDGWFNREDGYQAVCEVQAILERDQDEEELDKEIARLEAVVSGKNAESAKMIGSSTDRMSELEAYRHWSWLSELKKLRNETSGDD